MRRRRKKHIIGSLVIFFVAIVYMIPIVMMVLGAFKDSGEALALDLSLPSRFLLSNFKHVIETGAILRGYRNSLIITVSAVFLILFCGATTGIIISRRKDRKGEVLYYYYIFGLTTGMHIVTTYMLMINIGLYNSYIGVILIFVAVNMPFTVMTFTSFVNGVPKEIDEAAIVDGCGPISLMVRILFPILKPIMVTNLIIAAISVWNNFMIPLYLFNSSDKSTIPLTVFNFFGLYSRHWNYVFAALILTVLPVVILYLLLQKYIVSGMTSGAIKS